MLHVLHLRADNSLPKLVNSSTAGEEPFEGFMAVQAHGMHNLLQLDDLLFLVECHWL